MKKTLVSAITAALVVGAASTTFAAANPFSDVPTDSWAYNAVVILANDGVIDGFPNGTFQGNKNMTRYEMAQIIARAMAKENMSKADKATVQKLAAEFADELNNLGVKVANLEAKSDNVKLTGKVGYTYTNINIKGVEFDHNNDKFDIQKSENELLFRLEPTAMIGNGWTAHARLNAKLNAGQDEGSTKLEMDRAYVEGPLAGATITAGKLPVFIAEGLVFDSSVSGIKTNIVNKDLAFTAVAGRYNIEEPFEYFNIPTPKKTVDLYGGQIGYTLNDNLSLNAGYMELKNFYTTPVNKYDLGVWYAGANAKLTDNIRLSGEYAKATKGDNLDNIPSKFKKAYSVELNYKAADEKDAGSYGVYAAYRHLGIPAIKPTYDGVDIFQKGMEYGVKYVPTQNVVATVKYFKGKEMLLEDASKFYGSLEFLF